VTLFKPRATIPTVRQPRFLCEQSGPAETELKALLLPVFAKYTAIRSAYLVRVTYGDALSYDVALCLTTAAGIEEPELVVEVDSIFDEMFGPREHLDILFVEAQREKQLQEVCRPFWRGPITS